MMKRLLSSLPLILLSAVLATTASATVRPDDRIARQWNQFVDNLIKLNEHLIKQSPHEEKWRIGGYSNEPRFFDEVTYTNSATDKVTSIVQWERANPSAVHSIEIKLRDNQGRVIKDFSASYLTKHRNAPIQTLITIHYYNKQLHGFRVFDASLNRIYEVCRGKLNGKTINIDIDDDYGELSEALENPKGIMNSKTYKACFGSRDVDMSRVNIPTY